MFVQVSAMSLRVHTRFTDGLRPPLTETTCRLVAVFGQVRPLVREAGGLSNRGCAVINLMRYADYGVT